MPTHLRAFVFPGALMPAVDWTLWHAITHKHRPHDRPYDPEPHAWQPADPEAWGLTRMGAEARKRLDPGSTAPRVKRPDDRTPAELIHLPDVAPTLTSGSGKVETRRPLTEGDETKRRP